MLKYIKEIYNSSGLILGEIYAVADQDHSYVYLYDGEDTLSFTYEEIREHFKLLSEEEESELLKKAAQPMIDYLNRFYDKKTSAIISDDKIEIMLFEKGLYSQH